MKPTSSELSDLLDNKDRNKALSQLEALARAEASAFPPADKPGNLHAHTFYSFNPLGYSPAHYALLARRFGMEIAGIVDFDVLDGLAEFHEAGRLLNLRTVVSMETRVFAPEFADRVINSPGEPGIAYHMAAGFARPPAHAAGQKVLADLREGSAQRNRVLVQKVNAALAPVILDYDREVLPLTPEGNATERHIALAYARKGATLLAGHSLLDFWNARLASKFEPADLPDSPRLVNQIRAKMMKKGGPGYVAPGPESFPLMADFNRFAVSCGALPMVTWLDGTSAGEQCMDELCDVAAASGACSINIIPDRNFTPGVKDEKLRNLYDVVALARRRHWPVIAGTEMNSPGQKFVDDFGSEELKPITAAFQHGARILYGHTVLQRAGEIGYVSDWAEQRLPRREDRNAFYETVGRSLDPAGVARLGAVDGAVTPDEILRRVKKFQ